MSEKYLVGKFVGEGELAFVNFESFFEFWTKKKNTKMTS